MRRCTLLLVLIISLLALPACQRKKNNHSGLPEQELNELDQMLRQSKDYDAAKLHVIDSLQVRLSKTPASSSAERARLLNEISAEYSSFCSDSSVIFTYRALALESPADSAAIIDTRIRLVHALATSGIFSQAEAQLDSLNRLPLNTQQKLKLANAGRQLYSYMRGYLDEENSITPYLTHDFVTYDAYLRENLPSDSKYRQYLEAEQLVRNGHFKEARRRLENFLKGLPATDKLYAMAAYQAALASRNMGDDYNYGRYLAISAKADVQGSVKETLALPALAGWLYDKGEVDRAYRYINSSLSDANVSNARMRTVSVANSLPIIDESYRHRISASRDELMVYLLLVIGLLITSAALLIIFLRNLRKSNQIRQKLKTQTKMQENYIGHFLGLCSSYTDKLDSMRRLVHRKISAGQTDELLKMMKNSRNSEDQADDFFKVFDETFLDLYPYFIDKFNELLRPEERISYTKGTPLSTELRIYAFVRLGVQESVRISQILRCSVSTIYTYRNRMRGRAINRDTFESQVASLCSDG